VLAVLIKNPEPALFAAAPHVTSGVYSPTTLMHLTKSDMLRTALPTLSGIGTGVEK
jgi:hypothetical protein